MLLYSHTISPRLQYIVDFIGKELFDQKIQLTDDEREYRNATVPRINYSAAPLVPGEFFLQPVPLLFEKGIHQPAITVTTIEGNKALFPTTGDFPFDIFAASFYLLSRYEEYLPHAKDEYGRYSHKSSIAYQEGFLHLPMVNIWLATFEKALHQHFPALRFKGGQFKCILSYDIDIAYSYKYKGFWRTLGGFARSITQGNWNNVKERWQVLRGKKKDPFDCFEWLDALHLYCRLKPYYFFLVARRQMGVDKNTPTHVKAFRDLIEYYAGSFKVGLHPSWQSGDDNELLKEELQWLEVVSDKKIVYSRQHYIRFTLPETFRRLVDAGIQKEFSMGYGTINGFRASVCSTFYWYDLEKEKTTSLLLYPYCFMDANAYYEQRNTPQEAYNELMQYYTIVKKYNGILISIWHNSILGTDATFKGWREMFELFMKETVYWDAYLD